MAGPRPWPGICAWSPWQPGSPVRRRCKATRVASLLDRPAHVRRMGCVGQAPNEVLSGLCGLHEKVLEVARAVGLRPEPYLARYRLRQRVFKREIAVNESFEVGAGDRHLEFVPLIAG